MFGKNRFVCVGLASLLALSLLSGCGGGGAEGAVLVVDAEFDPAAVSNLSSPIGETTTSAAQIFEVIQKRLFMSIKSLIRASSGTGSRFPHLEHFFESCLNHDDLRDL